MMRPALIMLTLLASTGVALAASQPTCADHGKQYPDIVAGRIALQRTPTLLGKRMEVANLLQKAGCYDDAVHLLEDGQQYHPYNPALLFDLRHARNKVKEEHHHEAETTARLNRDLQRCTDNDGDVALQACKSALVKGAPNEFEITVRIALLQQSANHASQALDSFIAANSLRPGDKGVALAILALLDSTHRKDAIALAARGTSLTTLGRAREAVAALRAAKSLEPELPDIDQQLKAAEALARSESAAHKERPTQVAAISAAAEAMVEPQTQTYSNVAEASRSN